MAWDRVVSLRVGVGDPGVPGNALDVSALNLEFSVRTSRTFADNKAEFTIYNASEATRKQFLIKGATVVFGAGYLDEDCRVTEDGVSAPTIFWGYCFLSHTKQDGPHTVTKLYCKISLGMHENPISKVVKTKEKKDAAGKVIQKAGTQVKTVKGVIAAADTVYLDVNYAPGTSVKTILEDIGLQLDFRVHGASLLLPIKKPNGYKWAGSVTGLLQDMKTTLEDHGLSLFEEANSSLIVYATGKGPTQEILTSAPVLSFGDERNPNTGLLGLEELEDEIIIPTAQEARAWNLEPDDKQLVLKKIRFKALLNAAILPNTGVYIDTNSIKEAYIVDAAEFVGDNFGGEFNLTAQAVG